MSVYDDIAKLIDGEEAELDERQTPIEQARTDATQKANAAHDAAIEQADAEYHDAMAPLLAKWDELRLLRTQVAALAGQAAAPAPDPQTPSAPASSAADTSDSSPAPSAPEDPAPGSSLTPEPAPEPSTLQDAPSTPAAEPEPTPLTPSSDASPAPLPTASPDEALDLATARGVDTSQPIAVPLTTGQIKVVTAGDVIAAADPATEDDALTTTQLDLRRSNSDWP